MLTLTTFEIIAVEFSIQKAKILTSASFWVWHLETPSSIAPQNVRKFMETMTDHHIKVDPNQLLRW